ncbi:MAG: Gfo/Idh/MocA family oxidoreductase [Bacteroidales bacterium]|jgi:hypothetical protein|nr:Gfo/Idh/MocA family oxidoreductase [Bacteroidales bacterium]
MRLVTLLFLCVCATSFAQVKVGIIGLDTSHSPAFIKLLNSDNPRPEHRGFRIVAAYPYGSQAIESSAKRIPGYIEEATKYGVEIVASIAELLQKVDCVLLETNDGNMHLQQAAEVIESGKPFFLDKPVAATLPQAIAIFMLAKEHSTPFFSSSALRFTSNNQAIRAGKYGKILGADYYSPHHHEPTHTDFTWYGIHGVEPLFTVMGTGCQTVTRISGDGSDVVVGLWNDGRIGSFRALLKDKADYGGTVFCEKGIAAAGGYDGYGALLAEILKFFTTGQPPVAAEETLEIFTFMEASNESKRLEGKPVSMAKTYRKAAKKAKKLLEGLKN